MLRFSIDWARESYTLEVKTQFLFQLKLKATLNRQEIKKLNVFSSIATILHKIDQPTSYFGLMH